MSTLDGITKMSYAETDIPTRTLALNATPDNGDGDTDDALLWILIGRLLCIISDIKWSKDIMTVIVK